MTALFPEEEKENPEEKVRLWVWISQLSKSTCLFCWVEHGTFHLLSEKFSSHPNCRCLPVPAIDGVRITESGERQFARLLPLEQLQILGSRKFLLYRQGVQLKHLLGSFEEVSKRIQKLEENSHRNELFIKKLPSMLQDQMRQVLEFRKQNYLPDYYYLRPLPKELFPEAGTAALIRFGRIGQFGLNIKLQRNIYGKEDTSLHEEALFRIQKTGKFKGKTIHDSAVRFLKHAEADSIIRFSLDSGRNLRPFNLALTVDRVTCPECLNSLHLLLKAFAIRKVVIYDLHDNIVEISPEFEKGHRYLKKAGRWLSKE